LTSDTDEADVVEHDGLHPVSSPVSDTSTSGASSTLIASPDDRHDGVAADDGHVAVADAAHRHGDTVSTAVAPLVSHDIHGPGFVMPEYSQQHHQSGSNGGDFSTVTDSPMRDDWQRRGLFVANISAAIDGIAIGRIFGAFGPVRMVFDPWYNSLCSPMQRRYAFVL
jgi:hypothetical protein